MFKSILLISSLFLTLTSAQTTTTTTSPLGNVTAPGNVSVSSIPQCAITCTLSVLPKSDCSSYGVSNLTCLCTSTDFQSQFLSCQSTVCSPTELTLAENFGVSSCAAVGHPITIANNTAPVAKSTTTAAGTVPSAAATPAKTNGGSSNKNEVYLVGMMVTVLAGAVGLVL